MVEATRHVDEIDPRRCRECGDALRRTGHGGPLSLGVRTHSGNCASRSDRRPAAVRQPMAATKPP
jgi:hypothetical protein